MGLDIGSASVGWAVIDVNDFTNEAEKLLGLGVRVIHYADDSAASKFSRGRGETPCSNRTMKRQMRRQLDRWQLHREQLRDILVKNGFIASNEAFEPLNPEEQWRLRADAARPEKQLTLAEIARVLLHINHRRGYMHAKSDMSNKKETEHVAKINSRYKEIKELQKTVGQYLYDNLMASETVSKRGKKSYTYRIKEKVFPRMAYKEEVKQILESQAQYYPDILTPEVRDALFNVIFYQRPLKSCKHLVALCDFEKKSVKHANGQVYHYGPRVAPRSSPLAQMCRLYEVINNIRLENIQIQKEDVESQSKSYQFDDVANAPKDYRLTLRIYPFSDAEREAIFKALNEKEKLTFDNLKKLISLDGDAAKGLVGDKQINAGIKGNDTYRKIALAIKNLPAEKQQELLRFEVYSEVHVDPVTGQERNMISADYQKEPLYMLWHTLYSIDDRNELFGVLRSKFGIEDEETLDRLFAIDFVKDGYSNKSALFIRKILPMLMVGNGYSVACKKAGVNHSNSLTKEENEKRELKQQIDFLRKGELRQPIVESILNQTIALVNAIKEEFGEIDEVRVEMARELKQSKTDRAETTKAIAQREKENQELAEQISGEGIRATKRRVQKMRMLEETGNLCMYCNTPVTPVQFLEGNEYEMEHIIPRSRYFDDSFANKVCACRECNHEKGNKTGYDYMKGKTESEFNAYLLRVKRLLEGKKISKKKYDYLLMPGDKIPDDFVTRNINETRYINRKVIEILRSAFRNVYATSGEVTAFFRNAWGYDTMLHDLNLPMYRKANLTEQVEYITHGQKHTVERIKNWSKRNDHRHHAVDALVIALTRQGYIQRLNKLNTIKDMPTEYHDGWQSLKRWSEMQPHFDRGEVMQRLQELSISFKRGKKLTTPGRKQIVNGEVKRQAVPRSALHNDWVYGKILLHDGFKTIQQALAIPQLICDPEIKAQVLAALEKHNQDQEATDKYLDTNPIKVNGEKVEQIRCFKVEVVKKYKISAITKKNLKNIIDDKIRDVIKARLEELTKESDFEKSLAEHPLYSDAEGKHEIKTVRCRTGNDLSKMAVTQRNERGEAIGYGEPDNNHHLAFYKDAEGKLIERVVSFWACIKRQRYGIPTIIENPSEAWNMLKKHVENDDIRAIKRTMPSEDSTFWMSLQRNEMFVLGMTDDEWRDAVKSRDYATLNKHLYRVWKLAPRNYCFKRQTNTQAAIVDGDKEMCQHYILGSVGALMALNPRKVSVNLLSKIMLPEIDD